MRFLADESLEFPVVLRLRALGHDVRSVLEEMPGSLDERVLDLAARQHRILITNDLDFGTLVYRDRRASGGVILLRLEDEDVSVKIEVLEELLSRHGRRLPGSFAVVGEHGVRFRPLPHH